MKSKTSEVSRVHSRIDLSSTKTVIFGKNNSGKSNIIKALDIILGDKNPYFVNLSEGDFFNKEEPIEITLFFSEISKETDYHHLNFVERSEKTDKGRITISSGNLWVKFTGNPNGRNEFTAGTPKNIPGVKGDFQSGNDSFRRSLACFICVPADRNIDETLKNNQFSWFNKLLRGILDGKQSDPAYQGLKDKLASIEDDFKALFQIDRTIEVAKFLTYIDEIKFSLSKSNEIGDVLKHIEILVKDSSCERFFDLSRMGNGTQSSIIIGLFEMYLESISARNNSRLNLMAIDEPENFLHPQGKRLINDLLEGIAEKPSHQVIYTTHSPELISDFKPGQYELSDIVQVYKRSGATEITTFSRAETAYYSKISEEINATSGEMFFAEKILLTEGETEKHSVPNIFKYNTWQYSDLPDELKVLYDQEPDEGRKSDIIRKYFDLNLKNISVIDVGGKNNLPKYFEFGCKLVGIGNVMVLMDKDHDFDSTMKQKVDDCIKKLHRIPALTSEYSVYNWHIIDGEFESYYVLNVIQNLIVRTIEEKVREDQNLISIPDLTRRNTVMGQLIQRKKDELATSLSELSSAPKISDKWEEIFKKFLGDYTKPMIAFRLSKYLIKNGGYSDSLIQILKKLIS